MVVAVAVDVCRHGVAVVTGLCPAAAGLGQRPRSRDDRWVAAGVAELGKLSSTQRGETTSSRGAHTHTHTQPHSYTHLLRELLYPCPLCVKRLVPDAAVSAA